MGRSNNFLHPLHAPAQKCSASSCCGHIVIACEDGISVHKPPVCFYLFFRWTLDLSCFHRSSGDAVSGHNTSPWLRAWCSCCSDALHGELLKSQPETQCKRGKVCTWDCPCPCWCHSYQVTVTVFLKKKIGRSWLNCWLQWSLTHLQLDQGKDLCISLSAYQVIL